MSIVIKNQVRRKKGGGFTKATAKKKNTIRTVVQSPLRFPLGTNLRTVMHYADSYNLLTGGVGNYQENSMNLNSLFKPDATFAGHQPYGFDTLTEAFNRYRVYKVSWKITAQLTGTNHAYLTVYSSNVSASVASHSLAMESPLCINRALVENEPVYLSGTIDLAKLTGRTKAQLMADDRYQGKCIGPDPVEIARLHIGISGLQGVVAVSAVCYTIQTKYWIEFFDPNELPQS